MTLRGCVCENFLASADDTPNPHSLTNLYNLLPTNSPLRPQTLTALFQMLTSTTTLQLSLFPLTTSWLTSALSQWSLSASEKVAWLTSVADTYESAASGLKKGDKEKALEIRVLALRTAAEQQDATATKEATHRALKALLAIPSKFDLDQVLCIKGARQALDGPYAELVKVFEESDLDQGLAWAQKNGSFLSQECESHVPPQFLPCEIVLISILQAALDTEQITRKLRLLALTDLAASSSSKDITYAEIAKALKVEEDEIEIFVIDGMLLFHRYGHCHLFNLSMTFLKNSYPLAIAQGFPCSAHQDVPNPSCSNSIIQQPRVAAPREASGRLESRTG